MSGIGRTRTRGLSRADALRNVSPDFYAAVAASERGETHRATIATFDDGCRVAELVDAVLESAAASAWTDLTPAASVDA